jgi:hypothetical protein
MNDAASVFAGLAEVKAGLRALLSALDGGGRDSSAYREARARVDRAAAVLGDPKDLGTVVGPSEHDRLARELEEWLSLVALVATVAEREADRVQERLEGAQRARRSLAALGQTARREEPPRGGTCDLSA